MAGAGLPFEQLVILAWATRLCCVACQWVARTSWFRITRQEFLINQKVARELGVTIPPEVLKRADRVIE